MRAILKQASAALGALVALGAVAGTAVAQEEKLKPFVLAKVSSGTVQASVESVKQALTLSGFEVVGEYSPYENAHVVVFTGDALKEAAAQTARGGFAAAQRASVTKVDDEIQIAYTNPVYVTHAYRLKSDLAPIADRLSQALGRQKVFGAEGLTAEDLRGYHYTFGMEYFDDVYDLAGHGSYEEALRVVEDNLEKGVGGITQVYRIDIPGKKQTIFGVSRDTVEAGGDKHADDDFIMGIVDHKELRQTAYLPYEIMVDGGKVVALHMRFRMAVHFPDTRMVGAHSFFKLMPSPDAIEKVLQEVAGGEDVWG